MRRFLASVLLLAALSTAARADAWRASLAESEIVVHVWKKGLFSGFAHDHHFQVSDWSATASVDDARPEAAQVEVTLSARSLADRQRALSEEERRKVNRQAAGPEVLDAANHPTIEFRSWRLELARAAADGVLEGTLDGALTLRGETRPARVAIRAQRDGERWRVRGEARVKQSDFGIRPFSGFGGTVGVKDELTIELSVVLVRAAPRQARGT